MTAPLVDKELDLRDFPFMPIDITRLLGSDFNSIADDTAWRVGMVLWLRSYHQVPAGSLPADDGAVMRLAELGKDAKTWKRIKAAALRGWIACDDGRLYHPVVCEKALEGWVEKLAQRKSSEAGNAKRYGLKFDPAPYDAAMERTKAQLAKLNPRSRALNKKGKRYAPGSPDGSKNEPANAPDDAPDGRSDGSTDGAPVGDDLPPSKAPKRRDRDREERLITEDAWVSVRERVMRAFEAANNPHPVNTSWVEIWRQRGHNPEICLAVVRDGLAKNSRVHHLKFFDAAIADAHVAPRGQARAGPSRARRETISDMARMSDPETSDEQPDNHDKPSEGASAADAERRGFAGRLSVEDAATARRNAMVDH